MKKIGYILLLLVLVGLPIAKSSVAMAASGVCFFTSSGGPIGGTSGCAISGYGTYANDVFSGRLSGDHAIPDCVTSKSEFIAYIVAMYNNTNFNVGGCTDNGNGTQDRIGAALIIQNLRGKSDMHSWPSSADLQEWVDLMQQSSVKVVIESDSDVKNTSWFDTSKDNVFFDYHSPVLRRLITIKQKIDGVWKTRARIESLCGNLLANPNKLIEFCVPGDAYYPTCVPPSSCPPSDPDFPTCVPATHEDGPSYELVPTTDIVPNIVNVGNPVVFNHTITPVSGAGQPAGIYIDGDAYGDQTPDSYKNWSALDVPVVNNIIPSSPWSVQFNETYDTRGERRGTTRVRPHTNLDKDYIYDSDGVQVNGWGVTGSTTFAGANIVPKGTNVTFTTTVTNSESSFDAMAPTHKNINVQFNSDPNCVVPAGLGYTGSDSHCTNTVTMNTPGLYCPTVKISPNKDNDPNPIDSSVSCLYVIDVSLVATGGGEYEKGGTGLNMSLGVAVDSGGVCPAPGYALTISWSLSIPVIGIVNEPHSFVYGDGNCSPADMVVNLSFTAAQKALLNSSPPGQHYPATVTMGAQSQTTEIAIVEVPFARFYGNDIVARAGEIRFNETPGAFNATVGGQGSASQFGVFSTTATNMLSSAAFRYGLPAASPRTQPADGLKSNISGVVPKAIDQMIDGINIPVAGCSALVFDTFKHNVPLNSKKCFTETVTAADVYLGGKKNGAGWNAGDIDYTDSITIKNKGRIIIENNIINNSSPSNAGVMLVISDGDIYIDGDVTRIDAILLTKGTIYTCTNGLVLPATADRVNPICRNTNLTINGALAANTAIRFERSSGSRYLSNENTQSDAAGAQNIGSRLYADSNIDALPMASEVVNFPAYLYFAHPYLNDSSGTTFTSLVSSPPRL